MKDEEILKKAIEKISFNDEIREVYGRMDIRWMVQNRAYFVVIFSHDFAKAFWGEEKTTDIFGVSILNPVWQEHLVNMVLEENPIKYLEQFLSPIEGQKEKI